jgi:hypothetical protein
MPARAEIARVKTSVGSAMIERGANRLPATPGLQLNPGDKLVTGKDGRISVSFIDNTRFSVGPNSRIAVNEFNYDRTRQKGSFVTQVDRGSLAVVSGKIAKSDRDAMKVRTPNTLLGVRGTKFIVEVPQ